MDEEEDDDLVTIAKPKVNLMKSNANTGKQTVQLQKRSDAEQTHEQVPDDDEDIIMKPAAQIRPAAKTAISNDKSTPSNGKHKDQEFQSASSGKNNDRLTPSSRKRRSTSSSDRENEEDLTGLPVRDEESNDAATKQARNSRFTAGNPNQPASPRSNLSSGGGSTKTSSSTSQPGRNNSVNGTPSGKSNSAAEAKRSQEQLKEEEVRLQKYYKDGDYHSNALYASTVCGATIKKIIDVINPLTPDVVFRFTPEGLTIFGMEQVRMAIVSTRFDPGLFTCLKCDQMFEMSIETQHLSRLLQNVTKYDSLVFYIRDKNDPLKLGVILVHGKKRIFNHVTIIGNDTSEMGTVSMPDKGFKGFLQFPSSDFENFIHELYQTATVVTFGTNFKDFRMITKGTANSGTYSPRHIIFCEAEGGLKFVPIPEKKKQEMLYQAAQTRKKHGEEYGEDESISSSSQQDSVAILEQGSSSSTTDNNGNSDEEEEEDDEDDTNKADGQDAENDDDTEKDFSANPSTKQSKKSSKKKNAATTKTTSKNYNGTDGSAVGTGIMPSRTDNTDDSSSSSSNQYDIPSMTPNGGAFELNQLSEQACKPLPPDYIQASYMLKYLNSFVRAATFSKTVVLLFHERGPAVFHYPMEKGKGLTYILADISAASNQSRG